MDEYGRGRTQQDLMTEDIVVCVNELDEVLTGRHASKLEAHAVTTATPQGLCHRAFSVLLLNSQNQLLLTRRARSKILFPGIWIRTPCTT